MLLIELSMTVLVTQLCIYFFYHTFLFMLGYLNMNTWTFLCMRMFKSSHVFYRHIFVCLLFFLYCVVIFFILFLFLYFSDLPWTEKHLRSTSVILNVLKTQEWLDLTLPFTTFIVSQDQQLCRGAKPEVFHPVPFLHWWVNAENCNLSLFLQ